MGEQLFISVFLLGVLCLTLASGIWIAIALLAVGFIGMTLFTTYPTGGLLATTVWGSSTSWALTALPMFIWMGEILFRSRIAGDLFRGLAPWMNAIPGRLMHCNVIGCGIFAAISGSSAATTVTVGKITTFELQKRGYDEAMAIGSLAGAGTLGILIPPSIIMIIYGVSSGVSIARLFVAGILPGIMLLLLFSGYIAFWALRNPDRTPPPVAPTTLRQKLWEGRLMIPTVLLIIAVIGSIYTGIASPTESAVLGVVGALLLSWISGGFSWKTFVDGVLGATRTSCMIAFILIGAGFLTTAMGFTGVPLAIAKWITGIGFTPVELIIALTLFYMVLGCFLDGISVVVLTASVILPTIQAAGIDLLWFGIFLVLVCEMGSVTPPVGFNLYVMQAFSGKDLFFVARAAFPFFLLLLAAVVFISVFPEIVSYLPSRMF